jgi:hypothetical protein
LPRDPGRFGRHPGKGCQAGLSFTGSDPDPRNEQQDCCFSTRLRRHGKRVWLEKEPKLMDAQATELTIKAYLKEVRDRLDKAAGIARAADACAGAGFYEKAVEITMDIEQPIYEATTLMNAASLIHRISRPD